jgi:hypothetical protein
MVVDTITTTIMDIIMVTAMAITTDETGGKDESKLLSQ